jgi:hypothetical protein
MTLTINITSMSHIELLTDSGAWVGPGFGKFRSTDEARTWGTLNGYKVAEVITVNRAPKPVF